VTRVRDPRIGSGRDPEVLDDLRIVGVDRAVASSTHAVSVVFADHPVD